MMRVCGIQVRSRPASHVDGQVRLILVESNFETLLLYTYVQNIAKFGECIIHFWKEDIFYNKGKG